MKNTMWLTLIIIFNIAVCEMALAGQWRKTAHFEDRQELITHLNAIVGSGEDVDGFAQRPDGSWLLASGTQVWSSASFPSWFYELVRDYVAAGNAMADADCNAQGACLVIYENWGIHKLGRVPQNVTDRIERFSERAWKIRDVEITNRGYVLLGPGNVYAAENLTNGLGKALKDTHKTKRRIRDLSVGFDNEWALIAGHNPMHRDLSTSLVNTLQKIANSDGRLRELMLGRNNGYFVYTRGSEAGAGGSAINAVEWGLGPLGNTNIWQRMEQLGIAGLSVAIIEPNTLGGAGVRVSRGYGLKKIDVPGDHVLSDTPFALASLSKYLSALTVLRYAYSNNIALNENIFALINSGQSTVWRNIGNDNIWNDLYDIPDNNLSNTITLRSLMNHTANFPTRGVWRIPRSLWPDASSLSTLNWLLGWRCDQGGLCQQRANSATWQNASLTGQFSYSNPGYMVLQSVMEDLSGLKAEEFLDTFLFQRLDMKSANAKIDKSLQYLSRTAWYHGSTCTTCETSPASDWVSHPNIFASNIYASSGDYAKAMVVALNQGRDENNSFYLPQEFVNAMLIRQSTGGPRPNYGFGIFLDDDATEGTSQDFDHGGRFTRLTRTDMCGNPTENQGIVILSNTDSPGANTIINEIYNAYLNQVGWANGSDCQ